MNLRHITAIAVACSLVGCSKNPEVDPAAADTLKMWQDAGKEFIKKEEEGKALAERIKADPSPLFEKVEQSLREQVAQTFGDDSASKAVITPDKQTLKTFGPEKWKLSGNLKAFSEDGDPFEASWKVTVEMLIGELMVKTDDFTLLDEE